MEFPYQPASASSTSQVLMLAEFTLLQNEVDHVNQYLLNHHWTVTTIHNHQFFENPPLIYLHAQNKIINTILQEIRMHYKRHRVVVPNRLAHALLHNSLFQIHLAKINSHIV